MSIPVEYFNLDSAKCRVQKFWDEQGVWSQATFGTDQERGPLGALKHLEKEAKEAQSEIVSKTEYCQEYYKEGLKTEIADCLFLTLDAARRSGMTLDDLLDTAFAKLEINKSRKWNKTTSDSPVEHVRE